MTKLKSYSLTLREAEVVLLEKLKADGLGTREIFRHALRDYYDSKHPAYITRKTEAAVAASKTPEQKCTDLGGEVTQVDGISVCKINEPPGLIRTIPLSKL